MKKVLIFRGGWDGHEPVETTEIVAAALRAEGFDVQICEGNECLEKDEFAAQFDLIIPAMTMQNISPKASSNLRAAVQAGTGLAGWHGGMNDAFRSDTEYQFMTGGQFVAHPGGIIDYHVQIVSDDPIVSGIEDFDYRSEQYFMHVDPSNEVLATTSVVGVDAPWCKGVTMPVIYKRMYGEGKVFYSSLGHCSAEFKQYPQMLEIMIRGIKWAMK